MTIPDALEYTAEHEWLRIDGDTATVGITDHAQQELGDIVFIDLPQRGDQLEAGRPCGEVESTKSVSELHSPAAGTVIDINLVVVDDPGLANTDPYGVGWLFTMHVDQLPELLDAAAYTNLTNGESA